MLEDNVFVYKTALRIPNQMIMVLIKDVLHQYFHSNIYQNICCCCCCNWFCLQIDSNAFSMKMYIHIQIILFIYSFILFYTWFALISPLYRVYRQSSECNRISKIWFSILAYGADLVEMSASETWAKASVYILYESVLIFDVTTVWS